MNDVESRTIRKVSARIIPFLILCYFVAYLDRVNVGFASLTMSPDLGLTKTMFGFGAGIFFFAYFMFEVPSNLALEKFGARKWIARIMISWGLLSGLMAAIPWIGVKTGLGNEHSFYLVRVLLGFAEAGFFPGIIFYLTLWFPAIYRARVVGYFMAAIPLSSVIGAPVSAQILQHMEGVAGLTGWQWLFIGEAAPAVLLAFVVLAYLTDRPAEAAWLAADERAWLAGRLGAEERQREQAQQMSVWQAVLNPRVLALAFVYFGAVACNYGVGYWLPQIVSGFGNLSKAEVGWIVAVPYLVGTIGMVLWGLHSDAKARAQGSCRRGTRVVRHRLRRRGARGRSDHQNGADHSGVGRNVRGAAGVLDFPDGFPERRVGCGRHRHNQCPRQPVGLRGALRDGLDRRRDAQLCGRADPDRGLGRRGAGDRSAAPA